MKDGKLYTSMVMILLAVGLAVYFGVYIVDTLYNPFSTTIAYTYTMNDSVEAEGVVVREERVLPEQSGIVESSRREGEKVGSGQTVALVHRDTAAQADQAELNELANEIEVVRQVLKADLDVLSAARHDETILQAMIAVRGSSATQSFSNLDKEIVNLKSLVLQRDYTYGGTLSQTELSLRLNELIAQEKALSARTGSATQRIYAPVSGIYSADVDGFESIFTVDGLSTLTESGLQSLLQQSPNSVGNVAGKLILGSGWYLALSAPRDAVSNLREGDTITVGFGGEFARDIKMSVTKIGDEEGEDSLIVLYSNQYMGETTLLRQTAVELIYQSSTGIRLPKAALRMRTKVDAEGVETKTLGVYTIMAGRAEFKPVTVLIEGKDFYVVEAAEKGKAPLRAGDEVIVYATDLYDGKQLN